ncbi:MAG: hypothetical protein WB611_11155 [Stellaceae bacterium]
MTANRRPRRVSSDALYESPRETAGRLTTTGVIVSRLVNEKVIPARSINGSRKIPKLATGLLLASAYEIWPPEYRPQYTPEELRQLAGITIEAIAEQLGMGRSSGYKAVGNHEIPAIQLPGSDRWVVPADAAARMEAYDLRNFRLTLPEHRQEEVQPLKSEADNPATDHEVAVENAANIREEEPRDLGLRTPRDDAKEQCRRAGSSSPTKV